MHINTDQSSSITSPIRSWIPEMYFPSPDSCIIIISSDAQSDQTETSTVKWKNSQQSIFKQILCE